MTASRTIANHASEFGGKRVLVTGGTRGAGKAIVAATHARDSAALMAAFSVDAVLSDMGKTHRGEEIRGTTACSSAQT